MTIKPNDCNQPEKTEIEIQKVLDHPVIGRGSKTGTLEEFKRQLRKVLKRRKLFKKPGLFVLALLLLVGRANACVASWYGEEHRGKLMANGRPFDPDRLTAASWFYPLGTRIRVQAGSRSVVVEITDRGPARKLVRQGRTLDLSYAAFSRLANPDQGLVVVSVSKLR